MTGKPFKALSIVCSSSEDESCAKARLEAMCAIFGPIDTTQTSYNIKLVDGRPVHYVIVNFSHPTDAHVHAAKALSFLALIPELRVRKISSTNKRLSVPAAGADEPSGHPLTEPGKQFCNCTLLLHQNDFI